MQFLRVILGPLRWLLTIIWWFYAGTFSTKGHVILTSSFNFYYFFVFTWVSFVEHAKKTTNSRSGINILYSIISTICTNTSEAVWHEVLNFSQLFLLAWRLPTVANIDGNCWLSVIYFPAHGQCVQIAQFQKHNHWHKTNLCSFSFLIPSLSSTAYPNPGRRGGVLHREAQTSPVTSTGSVRHPKSFPDKPGDIVSLPRGLLPGWACLKHLPMGSGDIRTKCSSHLNWFLSMQRCRGAVASHRWPNFLTHSKGRARPPCDGNYFQLLVSASLFFRSWPKALESLQVDWPVKSRAYLCCSAPSSVCVTANSPPVRQQAPSLFDPR